MDHSGNPQNYYGSMYYVVPGGTGNTTRTTNESGQNILSTSSSIPSSSCFSQQPPFYQVSPVSPQGQGKLN